MKQFWVDYPALTAKRRFFGLMVGEDQPRVMAEFQKCLATRQAFRVEYRVQRIDGSVRWITSTIQPNFDAEGRPTYVIGTVLDCTEQKLAEEWLHAQNEVLRLTALGVPLRQIFQAIVDMMYRGIDISMVALLQLDNRGHLRVVAGANVPPDYVEAIEAIGVNEANCMCAYSVVAAEPLFSNDFATDPRCEALRSMLRQHDWGSCYTFPILAAHTDQQPTTFCGAPDSAHAPEKVVGLFAIYRSHVGLPTESELEKVSQAAYLANIVIARDHAHQSLLASEHRFRELANAMPQLVWSIAPDGRCNYSNRVLKETIGEHGADDWLNVIHPDDQQQVIDRFTTAMHTGEPYTAEHRLLVQSTQSYRWYLARALPSRDADGNITVWYGAATDIDDLKRTESALREERDRLSAIATSSPSVLFTYMELPDGTQTVPYAAPSIKELIGADPEQLRVDASAWTRRVHVEDIARTRELLEEALADMSSIETVFRFHHPDKGWSG